MMQSVAVFAMAYAAALAGLLEHVSGQRRRPSLTLAVCGILGACLLLQCLVPSVLPAFRRDAAAVASGQWWRLVTALFFQDGGFRGGVFNIALLLFVGAVAEQRMQRWRWIAIYLIGGVASEWLALHWQPVGAGNSIATCALAGSILLLAARPGRRWPSTLLRILAVAAALMLLWKRDIHGGAFVLGAGLGAVLGRLPVHDGRRAGRTGTGDRGGP